MLRGLMMDRPLLVSGAIEYAAELYPDVQLVSTMVEGGTHSYGYGAARQRIVRLASALKTMGIKPGDRVATLAWNGYRHFELYYAISGLGAVCHTINPRLFPEQLSYIVDHAADRALFFDLTFLPLIEKMRPAFRSIETYAVLTDRVHFPKETALAGLVCYEELLASGSEQLDWPEFDENTACALCYTSGTTGEPKGVLYSHRSNILHALFTLTATPQSFGPGKPLLPVVPLFHVNAWGLPYVAPLTGTPLVFPGAKLDGASIFDLIASQGVHSAWGVPTVWLGLLAEMQKRGSKPGILAEILTGGSAAPAALIAAFEQEWGINVVHGWGMTEMSPVGTVCRLPPAMASLPTEARLAVKARQGRRLFGVDMKIVGEDGRRLPHDGTAQGELFVRGPTIVSSYFHNEAASAKALDAEGWFATGDVAKITPDGFLVIVDRTKDLVKSGGEWISSLDVENTAAAYPGIAQCAVIGVPHPKWSERPLLVAVMKPGSAPDKADILAFLSVRLARWQVPDDVVFVESLPMTATGKVSKKDLRAKFAGYAAKDP
ncbi:MAG: long-chain fatty acid--CoA ligase [Hyphomicrobiaceae bacterium]